MKVIIVDDSRVTRIIIERTVQSIGYETLQACNGQEALDLLEKGAEEVGLVILDWNMPVLNGWEALKAIRKNKAYEHICILMVSTESEEEKISLAITDGANGYLTKPFEADELTDKIHETLKDSRFN